MCGIPAKLGWLVGSRNVQVRKHYECRIADAMECLSSTSTQLGLACLGSPGNGSIM